jgi:two-component system phosphate regulon sensor histidine kinase PhoR
MSKLPTPVTRLLVLQILLIIGLLSIMNVPFEIIGFFLLIFIPLSAFAGRKIYSPLQAILKRARNPVEQLTDHELTRRDSEEWAELESALDQIRTDLKDKTEALLREREELATLMSAISEAILAVDPDGKLMFFNSKFAHLFLQKIGTGPETGESRLGEIFRTPSVLQAFEKVLHNGLHEQIDIPLFVKNESMQRHFNLSVSPLRGEEGPVYGAIGVFHDVTELKKAEKIRIEFVSNVSHELRTPLTAIKGYSETLRQDIVRKEYGAAEKFIEVILRNSDRLMRLIEDLLNLSALESGESGEPGESITSKTRIDVQELTEKVLQQLEPRRAEKKQQIDTYYEIPSVQAEPEKVEQVLVNLLENAIKYTPALGRLRVRWTSHSEGLRLQVSDNGPGIPVEHQPRLFERFYRVDQARSRELGGTGLGLAIVKHIMQRQGGSIWVISEPGKGAEFICQFPLPS